jgi:hypothetical protein
MALDPEDPLIPLPWQMENIKKYRASKELANKAEAMRIEKLRYDLEKAQEESMAGRVQRGEQIAMIEERARQRAEGVPIGRDVARQVTALGGMSLLEGTKAQSDIELQNAMEQGRLGAIRQFGVERGIVPSAKVDVGGITQTVPYGMAPQIAVDTQVNFYNAARNKYREVYRNQGYNDIESEKMANEKAASVVEKNSNSGKINLLLPDGSTLSVELGKAMEMAKDPSTPPAIKQQLTSVFGQPQQSTASSWVTKSLGR